MTRNDRRGLADEALLELVRSADADALEVVYDRHCDAAYSLAYRIVGSRQGAEDVVQEAFLAIWRNPERYRPERGSVRTWVLGIVHHRAVDGLRRSTVHARHGGGDPEAIDRRAAPERTEDEAVRRDETRRVRAALEGLPPDQLRVVELAYFGGFTHVEIAEMLAMPLGTVKGRMRLALDRMHATLTKEVA